MTVSELIEKLREFPEGMEVWIYNALEEPETDFDVGEAWGGVLID